MRIQMYPMFFLILFSSYGCKARSFNTSLRGKSDPSQPDQNSQCRETLSPKAPYSPQTLIQELTNSINEAGQRQILEQENFRDILFGDDTASAAKGLLKPELLEGDHCSLVRSINQSMEKPSFFYWLTGNGRTSFGGMALYKGDVFAEGFYRNRSAGIESGIFSRSRYDETQLLKKQPWFEWNQQSRKFTARVGNPLNRILSHLGTEKGKNTLKLYRGTNVKFSSKGSALASLNSFLFGKSFGGIFTTPSYEDAKSWANPVVLTAQLSPETLITPTNAIDSMGQTERKIYAGIEFNYVEIAFLYQTGDERNIFFDNISEKCVVGEKATGADLNFAPACK